LKGEPVLNRLYHRYKKVAWKIFHMVRFTACWAGLFCAGLNQESRNIVPRFLVFWIEFLGC
jgi:hypothetical protein